MYRITAPDPKVLEDYFDKYKNPVKKQINKILKPGSFFNVKLDSQKVRIGILNAESFTATFLRSLLDDEKLKRLLTSDIEGLLEIIKEVQVNVPDFRKRLSNKKYPHICETQIIEDFNAICRHIFVDSVFGRSSKNGFDRYSFVTSLNLYVCPYCGASDIRVLKDSRIRFQTEIDHYFPKSLYPFLALSYFNLIPCCDKCNTGTDKGTFDPYSDDINLMPLTNPYLFDHKSFGFNYSYTPPNQYDPESYEIRIDYSKPHLNKGYTEGIAIEELYRHDLDTPHLWSQAQSVCSEKYRDFAKSLFNCYQKECLIEYPNEDAFLKEIVIDFDYWSDKLSRQTLKYKFKKDILFHMLEKSLGNNF